MTKVTMPEPVVFGIFYADVMQGWAWGKDAAQAIADEDYPEVSTSVYPLVTTDQAEAYAAAKVWGALNWISVDDRLPEVGLPVLVYIPPGPDSHPGEVDIRFDFICSDYEYWHEHSEHYEHFLCVAKGDADCPMTGPSEKAPYSHWMPLPPPPSTPA